MSEKESEMVLGTWKIEEKLRDKGEREREKWDLKRKKRG